MDVQERLLGHEEGARIPCLEVHSTLVGPDHSQAGGVLWDDHQRDSCGWLHHRPYAYDVIIALRPHLGDMGLHVNAVVSDVPAADHKRVQGNGFCPQHGGAMTSMHKVYCRMDIEPIGGKNVSLKSING